MPTYDVTVEGKTYEVNAPDETTAWQWANYTHRQQKQQAPAPKESTIGSELVRGGKQLFSTSRTGIGALATPEESARAGVERSQQIAAEAGEGPSFAALRKAYEERGLLPAAGELLSQIPRAVAGQGAQLAAMAGGAKLGAMAGTAVAPGVGTIAGGILGAGATLLPQFFGANVERQAAEQMERGEQVKIDRGAAAAAAAGQAGIESVGTALVLGKRVVKGILGVADDAGLATAKARADLVKAAERSRLGAAGRGAAVGVAEIPVEVAQAVIERAQAGLDVMSPEAFTEYGENAYLAGLVGPTIGAATRVTKPGAARRKLAVEEQAKAAEERAAAAKAETERKKDPAYALQLDADYQAAVQRMKELQAAVPKRPAEDALPEEQMAYRQAVDARNAHLKDVLQPLAAEYVPRKAEIAQLKERQRVEAMSPLDYMLEQTETAPIKGIAPGEAPLRTEADTEIFPTFSAPAPEAQYAQKQMDLAKQQDQGAFEAKDFAEYLMQDPAMAQRLVETKTAIPGVSKKESDAILGGLKLQLQDRVKQARAATQEELQQRQADLKAQQLPAETDPLAMWKASVEETEDQATEELLRPNFETLRPSGPATVTVAPGITPMQNPGTLLKRLDDLTAARDKAAAGAETAFAAGNKELGVKKSQEREAAQSALNNIEQAEGTPRALLALRKAQDTALMNAAQLIDDLRVGRTLGGPEAATASSTPQTLINQINKQRDAFVTAAVQEAAATRRLFAKALTQEEAETAAKQMRDVFNEWVTRSMAQPAKAVNWVDQMLAQMQAEKAVAGKDLRDAPWVQTMKQDFIRAQMTEALTQRLGRQRMEEIAKGTAELKGAETELPVDTRRAIQSKASVDFDRLLKTAQEKALAQSTDPRPLEERRFGAYRAATQVLQEQLQGIAAKLKEVPRAPQRVEPMLKMQFPETEAAKVAEASGETAQTLEGSLRRRRDYVGGLIDQAFQTRKVPGIAQMLLTRAQDFTPNATNSFLDAAENIASRILRGQNIERSDLVAMRDEIRAAAMRPGEAEVAGEREGQRELFPAEERRALAPKAEQGALGTIREKPEAFQAVRAKSAAKQQRADAAAARGEKLTQDIKRELDRIDTERQQALEARVDERRDSLQSAWQSAVKKAKDSIIAARRVIQKDKLKGLKTEIDAIRSGGIEGLNKETIDRLLALRQQADDLVTQFDAVVEAAEFLPLAQANKWVAFERGALDQAQKALEASRTPQTVSALAQQQAALRRAETARLQNLKGEEKAAEAARMRAAQQGLGLPGVRREAGKVTPIEPEKTAEQKRAEAQESRAEARAAAAETAAAKQAELGELEQRVLDLGTQVAEREAAQKRARTPESKARIQEEIDALNKDATLAQAQLAALQEGKPRRKGPATAPTSAALGKRTALRTGYRKALESASEGVRKEREGETRVAGTLEREERLDSFAVGNKDIFFSRGPTESPSTTASVRTELSKAFPDLSRVQIYDSVDALVAANPQYEGRIPSDARGFVDTAGNKAFLIAENINKGDALAVLLHEVGAHIGLKNMLGTAQYNTLVKAVETWAKKNDGSVESRVAKTALERVEAAKTPANQKADETLAYAIEEAVKAGVKPMETKGALGRWLSQVAALMRKALEKFGLPPKSLDAQGLVDMAFGAAKMEMRGMRPEGATKTELTPAAAQKQDAALQEQVLQFLIGGPRPAEPAMLYRGVPKGASSRPYEKYTHVTPWASVAYRGGKGAVVSPKNTDLYEFPVNNGQKYYRAGALAGDPLETTEIHNAKGMTWDEVLDAAKNLYKEKLRNIDDRYTQQYLSDSENLQTAKEVLAGEALSSFNVAVFEADANNTPGFWVNKKVPAELDRDTPSLRAAASEEILFSRNLPTASRVANQIIGKQPTVLDNIKKTLFGLSFRTQVIDALAPLEQIAYTSMDPLKGAQMMYYLRKYGMRNNMTQEAIENGVAQVQEITRPDGQKERIIEAVQGANIKDIVKRLAAKDVVKEAGSADAANRLFTLYMSAIRGENKGFDKLNFGRAAALSELQKIERELASPRLEPQEKTQLNARKAYLEKNLDSMPTEADFRAAKAEIDANPTLKKAFDEAREMYNEYNTDLLNFLVQTGAISKDEAARLLRAKDYIPYYRMRGGNAELMIGGETPIRIGNLKDSPHLQELVGGEEPIFDFLTSSVQNTSMLLDMGLRNIAAKNVAYELADAGLASKPARAGKTGAPKGTLEFKLDGEDYFVRVDTDYIGVPSDLLVKGMAGIPTMLPQGLRLMGIPAQILRRAVTSTPVFAAKSLFRDSLGAYMLSGSDAPPLLSAVNQLRKASPLKARGITGGQTFTGTTEDISRLLKEMQEGRPGWMKAFTKMEALAHKADAATRQSQYESYRAQGLSDMEAELMALESMNFSKRGLSPTMHMASMLVPFLNAQIQGLDVLYKALTGNMPFNDKLDIQRKLFTRGASMFALTMAYAAAMQDDEEYKNAPPDVKYGNWFVRLPFLDEMAGEKVTLRVPIPFEVGYIFKALPEMLYNSMKSDRGAKEAFEALNHILIQIVPGGSSMVPIEIGGAKIPVPVPIPAAMKPVIEVGLGKSFFTGRDLESAREQGEVPGMRYRERTSEIAKYIGESVNFSPIRIEALVNGYTGGLGLLALQALSLPLPKADVVVPEKRWSELPLVGPMFQPADASNIIDGVYKDFQKVTQAKTTYDRLLEKGLTGKAQAFLQENLQLIMMNQMAGEYRQMMGELSENERIIRGSKLTEEEKRKLVDQIKASKIQIAASVRAATERKAPQAVPA